MGSPLLAHLTGPEVDTEPAFKGACLRKLGAEHSTIGVDPNQLLPTPKSKCGALF
ncbi:hypothetical protein SLEP1_g4271 [Rubroshorea leprosula]|uniref:Uncharacterized protein n=1 Tax=Rubroshorea leprosula TaxID=152421 RepID=A0AAV5HN69_9ROSI|nr:hypothetical protein SLEP1_g4271 [Rubroshorea leprosula]